jgi:hypothetical protein
VREANRVRIITIGDLEVAAGASVRPASFEELRRGQADDDMM